jgi:ferric-dicitrate binding protein FerR (iron transport regulator)
MSDDYLWDPGERGSKAGADPVTEALERTLAPLRYDPAAKPLRALDASPRLEGGSAPPEVEAVLREAPPPAEPTPTDEVRAPSLRPQRRGALRYVATGTAMAAAIAALLVLGASSASREQVALARKVGPPPVVAWDALGARLEAGSSIETRDRAVRIAISDVGHVTVAPNSKIAALATSPTEQRLELAHGRIDAVVNAPPRLFLVETPVATAIDLGCVYSLESDASGKGTLRVEHGAVSLRRGDHEVTVPAGARCDMDPEWGVGTPYFEDAPEALRAALRDYDTGKGGVRAVREVLRLARERDTLSLWHLFLRSEEPLRRELYERIAAVKPPPSDVSERSVLDHEPAATSAWGAEMVAHW